MDQEQQTSLSFLRCFLSFPLVFLCCSARVHSLQLECVTSCFSFFFMGWVVDCCECVLPIYYILFSSSIVSRFFRCCFFFVGCFCPRAAAIIGKKASEEKRRGEKSCCSSSCSQLALSLWLKIGHFVWDSVERWWWWSWRCWVSSRLVELTLGGIFSIQSLISDKIDLTGDAQVDCKRRSQSDSMIAFTDRAEMACVSCFVWAFEHFFSSTRRELWKTLVVNCKRFLSILHWNWTRLMMTTRELICTNTSTALPSNCWDVFFSFNFYLKVVWCLSRSTVRMWMNIMSVSELTNKQHSEFVMILNIFFLWFDLISLSFLFLCSAVSCCADDARCPIESLFAYT